MERRNHQNHQCRDTYGPVRLVVIQATPFCNIDCDYCYLPNRLSKTRFSLDLVEPVFTNLFVSRLVKNPFTVVWHAGEPLAVPLSFYEVTFEKINALDRAYHPKQSLVTHAIQTNGTLINQAWCDLFKSYNVNVGVSVDGPAFMHDAHRKTRSGKGTHARTMNGIAHLQKNNIDIHAITVLTKDSLHHPDAMYNFFVESGIKRVGFNIEEVEGINRSSTFDVEDVETRYRTFMKRIYELNKRSGALNIREFERIEILILGVRTPIRGDVSSPFAIVNIDHHGNFSTFSPELLTVQSAAYGDFILGNLCKDTLESVCDTEKFQTIYHDIQTGIALCRGSCEYFMLCGGGAPSNKYSENGTCCSTETMFCTFTKKHLIDILLEEVEASLGLRS